MNITGAGIPNTVRVPKDAFFFPLLGRVTAVLPLMKTHTKDETGDRGRKRGRGGDSETACS